MTAPLIPASDLMLAPGLVHLQTGGVGAMPRPVFEAMQAAELEVEADPARETYGPGMSHLEKVRARVAVLVNAEAEDIFLTTSATQATPASGASSTPLITINPPNNAISSRRRTVQ